MKWLAAVVYATAFIVFAPQVGLSQEVTLTSRDGSVEVTGQLLGFDGEFFRVDTVYGILTLDGSGVTCTGASCPNPEGFVPEFMISGASESGAVLIPALLEAFAEREGYALRREVEDESHFAYQLSEPNGEQAAQVKFRITSSDEGFADLLAQQADIALSFRSITDDERTRALEAGLGDLAKPARSRVAALDALVPVVAPGNPIEALTLPQLVGILAGEITNWSAVDGPDQPLRLHLRAPWTGLSRSTDAALLAPAGKRASATAVRHETARALIDAIEQDPFAIGISTFSEYGSARILQLKGRCGYLTRATAVTLKAEDYPLTAPHFIYTPARRLPRIAQEFLAYIQSPAAQPVIRELGFVDQSLGALPLSRQGDRLAKAVLNTSRENTVQQLRRMVAALNGAERLTVTFRFEGGEVDLDPQSRANVALLAEALERGRFDGRTILFAGFSDGRGDAASNRELSLRRARAVQDAVLAGLDEKIREAVEFETDGFGEAMPMACDADAWGQQVNRRVEIWLK